MRLYHLWNAWGNILLDFLFPPQCNLCGREVNDNCTLCVECWAKLEFITSPHCAMCGFPFAFQPEQEGVTFDDMLCGHCLANPKPYDKAYAVLSYNDAVKSLIIPFKHGDRTDYAPLFCNWLLNCEPCLFKDMDIIAPVPIHYSRLLKRKYNQAGILADALVKKLQAQQPNMAYCPSLLQRKQATISQGGLRAKQRRANVGNAFRLNLKFKESVKGKSCLLVDDVITTGATVEACAKTLKQAGARKVHVLAIARVVRPSML